MKAMLRFANGDRQEIELGPSNIRQGHPASSLMWRDGTDGVGGDRRGEREFWLDVPAYRAGFVRYVEVPPTSPIRGGAKDEGNG